MSDQNKSASGSKRGHPPHPGSASAQVARNADRARAGFFGLSGTVILHAVVLFLATNSVLPGKRSNQSASPGQATYYVALGDARATPLSKARASDSPALQLLSDKPRAGSGAIGSPMPKAKQGRSGADSQDESLSDYLPSNQLDIMAFPVSEPDYHILDGVRGSGKTIRLRLFIDAQGLMKEIRVVRAQEDDSALITRIKAMFFTTAFLPGRRNGKGTSSYIDIDLNIARPTDTSA
jgi:hypothetical protein